MTDADLVYLPDEPGVPAPAHFSAGGLWFARSSSFKRGWPQYRLVDGDRADRLVESHEYLRRIDAEELATLDGEESATEAILGGEFDRRLDAVAWYEREHVDGLRESVVSAIRSRSNEIVADVTPSDVDPSSVATR